MQFTYLFNQRILNQAWTNKLSVIGGVFALASLSLAHYAGFLMVFPLPILAIAGLTLAKGVTATFLFYVFFTAICARVFTSLFVLLLLPVWTLADRHQGGSRKLLNFSYQHRFVRLHTRTIKSEGYIWLLMQALIFVFFMLITYVEFSITWRIGTVLCVFSILFILSGLVRSGFFLQPRMSIFINKTKHRPARSSRVAIAVFGTVTGTLIIVSFCLGFMRSTLLRNQTPQMVG